METGLGKTVAFDLFSAGLHFSIILGRSPDSQAKSISSIPDLSAFPRQS
jgi:hypothetical protein